MLLASVPVAGQQALVEEGVGSASLRVLPLETKYGHSECFLPVTLFSGVGGILPFLQSTTRVPRRLVNPKTLRIDLKEDLESNAQ